MEIGDLKRQLQCSEALVADFQKALQQTDSKLETQRPKVNIKTVTGFLVYESYNTLQGWCLHALQPYHIKLLNTAVNIMGSYMHACMHCKRVNVSLTLLSVAPFTETTLLAMLAEAGLLKHPTSNFLLLKQPPTLQVEVYYTAYMSIEGSFYAVQLNITHCTSD